jgi:EAL domain-containing protein (putative c-di-GMP-specific phosphodiesterase class I)
MAEEADRKAKIEGELRRALDAGELFLHYQPQIELATQRVSAVEALVRWMRNGIAVPPVEFISLAESSGTIHDLGKWVIETACHQQAQWRRQGYDFKIGINVSPLQASTPDFISIVDRALERSGIEGRSVEFEITEGMLFNPESPSVAAFLGACRTRRIDLAVDDFGVGYSSLGYLARLPIAKVKIDRSFVSRVGASSDETVLGAMIDLGQKLGKRVVAEGVETDAQCAYLRSSGDLDAQGYFFAPPQLAETLDVWLRTAA